MKERGLLVYAVLIDASKRWHGVKMSVETLQELAKLEKGVRPQSKIEIPSLQKVLI